MTIQVTIPLPQLQINRHEAMIIAEAVKLQLLSCPDRDPCLPSLLAKMQALELLLQAQEKAQ